MYEVSSGSLSYFQTCVVVLVEQAHPEGRASPKSQFELGVNWSCHAGGGGVVLKTVVASLSGAHRFTRLHTKETGW